MPWLVSPQTYQPERLLGDETDQISHVCFVDQHEDALRGASANGFATMEPQLWPKILIVSTYNTMCRMYNSIDNQL